MQQASPERVLPLPLEAAARTEAELPWNLVEGFPE